MQEYRIDELARVAGTTVRNVRAYQDRGLLPPPRRDGRIGWYDEAHLARLRLISSLLERGYTLANISELLAAWLEGQDVAQLIGLEATLLRPWVNGQRERWTLGDVVDMFGAEMDSRDLANALRMGLITEVDGELETSRPATIRAAREMVNAGIPLSEVIEIALRMQKDLSKIAGYLIDSIERHLLADDEMIQRGAADSVGPIIERLRPLANAAIIGELGAAMDNEIADRISARLFEHQKRGRVS